MRDLDSINPAEAKPARFAGLAAILTLAFSLGGLLLAEEAAPAVPFAENPISLFSCIVLFTACVSLVAPPIFGWNWEAKYFGVVLFHIGSIALMCIVPCLCLALYGQLPLATRMTILFTVTAVHVWWCRRFIVFYARIYNDMALRGFLYEEEADAVYYMQRADKYLFDRRYRFNQLPQDRYLALFLLLAFSLTPVASAVRATAGLPFIHIFLLIGMLPVSLIGVGFAMRGWLLFYRYPMQIRKSTGKRVYVDMGSKPNLGLQRKHTKNRRPKNI